MKKANSETPRINLPAHVQDAVGSRLSGVKLQRLQLMFLLRSTAQQADNAGSAWLSTTAGSPARFQALVFLWAANGRPVQHQEIIAALRVKRATVSALMFSLEEDGLVESISDRQDRRRVLAALTDKGQKVIREAMDLSDARLEEVMRGFSSEELGMLQSLLQRFLEAVAPSPTTR